MSRAEKLLGRLREVKERNMITEQDDVPAETQIPLVKRIAIPMVP